MHTYTHTCTHTLPTLHAHTLTLLHRPKWVTLMGSKYNRSDYVVAGWQDDDLPVFGCIQDILVLNNCAMLEVLQYNTEGIDRHYHSYVLKNSNEKALIWLSDLIDFHPLQAHRLNNGYIYITVRSHIERV